jgi:uncharacterized protein (DUF1778 family)
MSIPRIPTPLPSPASPSGEPRSVLRAKTIATRVTPEELGEVETAAEGAGKTLAEWLRELALKAARERPADPTELVLAEVSALRYMLLKLFVNGNDCASRDSILNGYAASGRDARAAL